MNMRAVEFYLRPWTANTGRDAQITIDHVEVYNRADETDFGSDGKLIAQADAPPAAGRGAAPGRDLYRTPAHTRAAGSPRR